MPSPFSRHHHHHRRRSPQQQLVLALNIRKFVVMATAVPANVQLRQQLAPAIIPASDPRATFHNWARSYESVPITAFQPTTEEQCAAILRLAALEGRVVRAVGSGHSPSDLPCTSDFMVRMDKLNRLIEVRSPLSFSLVRVTAAGADHAFNFFSLSLFQTSHTNRDLCSPYHTLNCSTQKCT